VIRFGSVCSGIEAASVAWHPLGWQAAWLAEIEPFPCAVLAHHYPDVPNLGDMTSIQRRLLTGEIEAPDVLTGGTPCQAFSVAGKRESLADARGNLSLIFCEIADAIDHVRHARGDAPGIIVWENVPGVLSTRDNAFGCFLGALAGSGCELQPAGGKWTDAGCVYGPARTVAWRVLDAQYFGLAQRRKRVFVVASARDGFDPAAVLFESDGVRRDSAPRREAGQSATRGAGDGVEGGGWCDVAKPVLAVGNGLNPLDETIIAHTLRGEGFDASEDGTGRGTPLVPSNGATWRGDGCDNLVAFSCKDHGADAGELAPTLRAMGHGDSHANGGGQVAVAFHCDAQADQLPGPETDITASASLTCSQRAAVAYDVLGVPASIGAKETDLHTCLRGRPPGQSEGSTTTVVQQAMQVRRLTPRECERLQGFPDDYTLIPWRKKPAADCPDGPRYKALGNSWAVPCARWIGARIAAALARGGA
jgi:DNA (cytosine-5)-methyltransferase 1